MRQLFLRPLLLSAALLLAATAVDAAETITKDTPVTPEGVGPIRIGMTPAEASAAAGLELEGDPYELFEDGSCYHVAPGGALREVFWFMVSEGVIVRVDLWEDSTAVNAEGVKAGDSEAHLLELYKDATVEEHAYTGPEGHYVKTKTADGTLGYVFETDGGVVRSWRAGRYPEIDWIEGCV